MHPGQFRPDRKEKQRVNPVEKELTGLLADERYGTFIQTIRKIRFPANYRFDSHAHPSGGDQLYQFGLLYDGGGGTDCTPEKGEAALLSIPAKSICLWWM